MISKGQIIEIPASPSIYEVADSEGHSKREVLKTKVEKRHYGLFDGFLVGEHPGVANFRLGQRKGINVGGKNAPLYVIGINQATNQLFVGEGEQHPGLWSDVLTFSQEEFQLPNLDFNKEDADLGTEVSIHSEVMDIDLIATLYIFDGILYLEFEAPVPIAIADHPLEIYFDQHSTATIKIN